MMDFIGARIMDIGGDNRNQKTCKAPVKSYQQSTLYFFTGLTPFLSPDCVTALNAEIITFYRLAPKLT